MPQFTSKATLSVKTTFLRTIAGQISSLPTFVWRIHSASDGLLACLFVLVEFRRHSDADLFKNFRIANWCKWRRSDLPGITPNLSHYATAAFSRYRTSLRLQGGGLLCSNSLVTLNFLIRLWIDAFCLLNIPRLLNILRFVIVMRFAITTPYPFE